MKRAVLVAAATMFGFGTSAMERTQNDALDRVHRQMLERHNRDISTTLADCLVAYFDPLSGAERETMKDFFATPNLAPTTPPNAAVRAILATLPPQQVHMENCLEAERVRAKPSAPTSALIPDWSTMLSDDPEGYAPAFTFLAPRQGFRNVPANVLQLIGSGGVRSPLNRMIFVDELDAEVARLTGLELSNAHALMTFGDVRNQVTALAIPETSGSAFAAAFEARDFLRKDIAGQPVYHLGEDNGKNLLQSDPSDPFGGLMGLAQRVTLVGDTILFSHGWTAFEPAVTTLIEQQGCRGCATWQAMIEAVGDAYLEYASGWPAVSSFRVQDLVRVSIDSDSLPPFDLAMFAVTVDQHGHSPKLVVHFPDPALARGGAAEIVRRFHGGIRPGPDGEAVESMTVETVVFHESVSAGGMVAILAIETDGSMENAYQAIADWTKAILIGPQFRPLAWN